MASLKSHAEASRAAVSQEFATKTLGEQGKLLTRMTSLRSKRGARQALSFHLHGCSVESPRSALSAPRVAANASSK